MQSLTAQQRLTAEAVAKIRRTGSQGCYLKWQGWVGSAPSFTLHGQQGQLLAERKFCLESGSWWDRGPGSLPATLDDYAIAHNPLVQLAGPLPEDVRQRYFLDLSPDRRSIVVNPRWSPSGGAAIRGLAAERTPEGGWRFQLESGEPIESGEWLWVDIDKIFTRRADLEAARRGLAPRWRDPFEPLEPGMQKCHFLKVTAADDEVIHFLFDGHESRVITLCREVQVFPLEGGGPAFLVLRKPVLYLYPAERQRVRVTLDIDGELSAQYPRLRDGAWEMIASPDGSLLEPATGRRYGYLFWEARCTRPLDIDLEQAHTVHREDAPSFLERVADRFALNHRERTDFVTYWLPALEHNGVSVVQLLDNDAATGAHLAIVPEPDTLIRLFMVFRAAHDHEVTGDPDLPQRTRRGFTAVEWGGSNLDECRRSVQDGRIGAQG